MSILSRIDEFLSKEKAKELKKKELKYALKEGYDLSDLMDKMGVFIHYVDPNSLDDEGKRIRQELANSLTLQAQDEYLDVPAASPVDRSVEDWDDETSLSDYDEDGEIVDVDDNEEDEVVEEKRPARRKLQIKEAKNKCPKCGKPTKENTEGNPKYCQGH